MIKDGNQELVLEQFLGSALYFKQFNFRFWSVRYFGKLVLCSFVAENIAAKWQKGFKVWFHLLSKIFYLVQNNQVHKMKQLNT